MENIHASTPLVLSFPRSLLCSPPAGGPHRNRAPRRQSDALAEREGSHGCCRQPRPPAPAAPPRPMTSTTEMLGPLCLQTMNFRGGNLEWRFVSLKPFRVQRLVYGSSRWRSVGAGATSSWWRDSRRSSICCCVNWLLSLHVVSSGMDFCYRWIGILGMEKRIPLQKYNIGQLSIPRCRHCYLKRNIVTPILIILRLGYPSQKDRKLYAEKFARLNTEILCDLLSTAHGLELKPLVDLPSRALAQIIEGKIPEEIQDIIHLLDDLPEVIDVSGSL